MHPEEIRTRLARFVATRNARDLWPEISEQAFRAAHEEVARATASVLMDTRTPTRLSLPEGVDPATLGVAAFTAGVGPLFGFWVESGVVTAAPAVCEVLGIQLDHARRRAQRTLPELERLLSVLAERRVEVFLLRGSDTRYRYFPEPSTRAASDLHLLVRPADWEQSRRVLAGLGFIEGAVEPDRILWAPAGPPVVRSLYFAHEADPWSLELRQSLGPELDAVGALDGDVLREFSSPARVLRAPLLLTYLALYASNQFHATMLVRIVELVLVIRRDFHPRSGAWEEFEQLLAATGTASRVFPALELVERFVPGTLDPRVHQLLRQMTPRRVQREVEAVTPGSMLRMHPLPARRSINWDVPEPAP